MQLKRLGKSCRAARNAFSRKARRGIEDGMEIEKSNGNEVKGKVRKWQIRHSYEGEGRTMDETWAQAHGSPGHFHALLCVGCFFVACVWSYYSGR